MENNIKTNGNKYHILICGGRTELNYAVVSNFITSIMNDLGIENCEVISGGCKGADLSGERFAREHNYDLKRFLPDWKRLGRAAGIKRNAEMINYIKQFDNSIVIAFWNGESHGTKFTIEQAKKNNIPVYICYYHNTELKDGIIKTEMRLQKRNYMLYYNGYAVEPERGKRNKASHCKTMNDDKIESLIDVSLNDLTANIEGLNCMICPPKEDDVIIPYILFYIEKHYGCKSIFYFKDNAHDLNIESFKHCQNILLPDISSNDSSTVTNFISALDNLEYKGEAIIFSLNIP